jgi:hypothetical protein
MKNYNYGLLYFSQPEALATRLFSRGKHPGPMDKLVIPEKAV